MSQNYIVVGIGPRFNGPMGSFENRGSAEANIRQYIADMSRKLRGIERIDKFDVYLKREGVIDTNPPITTIYSASTTNTR